MSGVLFALRLGLLVVGLLVIVGAAAQQDEEEFFDLGITEYELSCMTCHGVDGHGDGPLARHFETKPTDLTQIAKANGGVFPGDRVAMIIDGRAIVDKHGPREMPVWGERYRRPIPDADVEWDAERRSRARIEALTEYVEGLQEP
ncbi:MAG: cytochrome c [Hyphomicrobiales bacterium]|nr:cytochrome c [Hyphomicrobiales bacterium]